MIAAAITGHYEPMMEIPPEIGDLKFYRKQWAQSEALWLTELEWEFCDRGDFQYGDIVSTDPKFFKTINSAYDLDTYVPSMRCLKNTQENLNIWGNYNSGEAGAIMIVFEKCDSEKIASNLVAKAKNITACESEENIEKWAKGRYLIVNENQKRFISHKFEEEKFEANSELQWFALNLK